MRLAIILAHRSFMCGQFALNLGPVVAGSALKIQLSIGKLVRIKAELCFGNFKIVSAGIGLRGAFCGSCGGARFGCQAVHELLIIFYELLELFDSLRQRKRFSGEDTMLYLRTGLAQGRGEGLIHFMIGQTFSVLRVFSFLGGDGQWSQSLGRLPGAKIDERLLGSSETLPLTLSLEEG